MATVGYPTRQGLRPMHGQHSRRRWLKVTAGLATGVLAPSWGQAAQATSQTLRVLCYNIHHGEGTDGKVDLPRIAQVILSARPDLVALQEVDDRTKRTGGVDQTAELMRLTELHGRFCKQIDYEGGGYGQAILSKFPLSEAKIHVLPGMPDRETRIAAAVDVMLPNQKLTFVTTHLNHQDAKNREQQAAKVNEMFAEVPQPIILAGDLNAIPDSAPLNILGKEWMVATAQTPTLTYPSRQPTKQLDYILCRPRDQFRVESVEVIDEAVSSDHRPILAVLRLL